MKARVKATGEIVDVFREPMIGGDGYAYYTEDRDRYLFDDLDFNIKEMEALKRELEVLKIEKTILENKVNLLKEERK